MLPPMDKGTTTRTLPPCGQTFNEYNTAPYGQEYKIWTGRGDTGQDSVHNTYDGAQHIKHLSWVMGLN